MFFLFIRRLFRDLLCCSGCRCLFFGRIIYLRHYSFQRGILLSRHRSHNNSGFNLHLNRCRFGSDSFLSCFPADRFLLLSCSGAFLNGIIVGHSYTSAFKVREILLIETSRPFIVCIYKYLFITAFSQERYIISSGLSAGGHIHSKASYFPVALESLTVRGKAERKGIALSAAAADKHSCYTVYIRTHDIRVKAQPAVKLRYDLYC